LKHPLKRAIWLAMATPLLTEIEAFLKETGMSEAQFCRAIGNGRLFERLRTVGTRGKPGRVWPETEAQVRGFMIAERQKRRVAA
jgi:hypothetical protein